MKEGRQSIIEYQRFGIQGKTCKKADGEICETICDRGSSLVKYSQTMAANIDENTFSSQCKPDNTV